MHQLANYFLIENAGRNMSIAQMFQQMFCNDFSEKGAQIRRIDGNIAQQSKNDKRFLENLDADTRKNGKHYEVPLLSIQKGIKIPNNRIRALKRMY